MEMRCYMENRKIALLNSAEGLKLLISRLPADHQSQSYLQNELHRTASGIRGELRIEARFNEFHLDEDFRVMWNVQLQLGNWPVQMDGLLLTERCAIVIESKNISGKIHFDEKTGEFYRFDDDAVKTVMEDPQIQLRKNIRFLSIWFKKHKLHLPIHGLIVFTAKKCEFITKPSRTPICKTYQMPEMLLKIWQASPPQASAIKLTKIKKTLQTNQSSYKTIPLCKKYFIDTADLKLGVYCRSCQLHTMQRCKRSWQCMRCGERDKDAHHLAVREYFTFVGSVLTNQEFRRFCGIDSTFVASRLLNQMDLVVKGELKMRTYELKKLE